jgi:hypothetical protein
MTMNRTGTLDDIDMELEEVAMALEGAATILLDQQEHDPAVGIVRNAVLAIKKVQDEIAVQVDAGEAKGALAPGGQTQAIPGGKGEAEEAARAVAEDAETTRPQLESKCSRECGPEATFPNGAIVGYACSGDWPDLDGVLLGLKDAVSRLQCGISAAADHSSGEEHKAALRVIEEVFDYLAQLAYAVEGLCKLGPWARIPQPAVEKIEACARKSAEEMAREFGMHHSWLVDAFTEAAVSRLLTDVQKGTADAGDVLRKWWADKMASIKNTRPGRPMSGGSVAGKAKHPAISASELRRMADAGRRVVTGGSPPADRPVPPGPGPLKRDKKGK